MAAKPITKGKLLRPGGPGGPGGPSGARSRPQPQVPQHSETVPTTRPTYPEPQQVTLAPAILHVNGTPHSRNHSTSSVAKAPPPPPPSAQKKDTYKALYAFVGQSNNELTIEKDEVIEVLQKESNGKPSLLSILVRLSTLRILKVGKSTQTLLTDSSFQGGGWAKSWMAPHKAGLHPPISQRHPPLLHRRPQLLLGLSPDPPLHNQHHLP